MLALRPGAREAGTWRTKGRDEPGRQAHRLADACGWRCRWRWCSSSAARRLPSRRFAYGRQAAQQAYDRLLIGAANQIAGSISIRGGEVVVDIPASAFELLALAPDDRRALCRLRPRRPRS